MSLGAIVTTTNPLNTANEIAKQINDSKPVIAFTTSQLITKIIASSPKLPIILIEENEELQHSGVIDNHHSDFPSSLNVGDNHSYVLCEFFKDAQKKVLPVCRSRLKTSQLLQTIHRSIKAGSLPHRMVIANDLDVQRCNLLIHQTKRMYIANLIITNHEVPDFQGCRLNRNC
ncbi:unnamed protein product [Lupinus luteus]|uniref:Uncharacterized protein n=1 Tax=Lupinus luteus TaxID=3873 RepID=A0AAV1WXU7_LUPLU